MNAANSITLIQNPQFSDSGLKVGDSVFVRVLHTENDKALVSFGGGVFQVKTKIPLEEGQGFKAKISLDNGRVLLTVLKKSSSQNDSGTLKPDTINLLTENRQIENYLTSLNIIPDSVSFKIVQYLQKMGCALNEKKLKNIRMLLNSFPGREGQAAQVAVYLEEKGIEATEKNVREFMGLLVGEKTENHFLKTINEKNINKKHWIIIPFDYNTGGIQGYGHILLLKNGRNDVERINFRLHTDEKSFFFVFSLKNSYNQARIDECKILFYIEQDVQNPHIEEAAKEFFSSIASNVTVRYTREAMDGLYFLDKEGLEQVKLNV